MTGLIHNPYWGVVGQHAKPVQSFFTDEPNENKLEIGGLPDRYDSAADDAFDAAEAFMLRDMAVKRWAWTVTDPASVEFVAKYSRGRLIDPMAGTGYWAMVLAQLGVDCVSYDLDPPSPHSNRNHWHAGENQFVTVLPGDAVDTVVVAGQGRTLFLSWPPMNSVAYLTLKAYPGDRLIYIGEGDGGCTADENFFALLEKEWTQVDWNRPVQFYGMHDVILVFDRIEAAVTT